MTTMPARSARASTYYWKCDRPAAFHATAHSPGIQDRLTDVLRERFGPCELSPGSGQGNHLTYRAVLGGRESFIRVEDGPERDDYMEVESHVLGRVREIGVRTPIVLDHDATRRDLDFAWQALEYIPQPDLNAAWKGGTLDSHSVAEQLGASIARWQTITPPGFGPFDVAGVRDGGLLAGLHASYGNYFYLRLDGHLDFLHRRGFLTPSRAGEIRAAIGGCHELLQLSQGCLVHKDMALWNVLGTPDKVMAVIDWDDSISGDPTDDLSLLACFHDADFIARAIAGYRAIRPLPERWRERFWLHLLRNMIVKAVIRVGAGYFDRGSGFFLIGSGQGGGDLREFTLSRIETAFRGLTENRELDTL